MWIISWCFSLPISQTAQRSPGAQPCRHIRGKCECVFPSTLPHPVITVHSAAASALKLCIRCIGLRGVAKRKDKDRDFTSHSPSALGESLVILDSRLLPEAGTLGGRLAPPYGLLLPSCPHNDHCSTTLSLQAGKWLINCSVKGNC